MIPAPTNSSGGVSLDRTTQLAVWKYHKVLALLLYANVAGVALPVFLIPVLPNGNSISAIALLTGLVSFALLPVTGGTYAFLLRRIRRRRRADRCLRCGYPRPANPEPVCTDCGEPWWWHRYEPLER